MLREPRLGESVYAILTEDKQTHQIFQFLIFEEVTTKTLNDQSVTFYLKSPYLKEGTKVSLELIRKNAFLQKVFFSIEDLKEAWLCHAVDQAEEKFEGMFERARMLQEKEGESDESLAS